MLNKLYENEAEETCLFTLFLLSLIYLTFKPPHNHFWQNLWRSFNSIAFVIEAVFICNKLCLFMVHKRTE